MCYIGMTEGKVVKEGKKSFSIFIFIYTVLLAYLKVYNKFENTSSNRSQEICVRILNQVVAENSLTEKNDYMYYIRVKEGKN